ncbi:MULTISPECIES: HelD family protein [Actinomyces]|uniref:AAA family ATPase n=1 Tax=Actinomyces respiraculi TaxID=2744574 RepID=A0A7T0LN72_9ACTO|nr:MULTISPECIES: AAA family ATPase [Actinomyces]QPL06258.1 AAA family ATPase [Actinomyces respiraculi]
MTQHPDTSPAFDDERTSAESAESESVESERARQVQAEQAIVDTAYGELDRQLEAARRALARTEAAGASGTHQSRGERDAYAAHYASLVSSLEGVEDRLVFGRMDLSPEAVEAGGAASNGPVTDGGRRHYVGRAGLQDERRREVVLDWRAPLARAFYQATARDPMGLVRRRHIDTRQRRVIGLEDEVIDVQALGDAAGSRAAVDGLQGEGALIAAMSAARDGRMGDIVATIQAEQDRIVTSDGKGILVVQGGPGTGKTAVALHRVAYLFYSERARLERSGVLLVGPSRTFLRYVEQVLPSLGETGVVATTIGDLVPGVRARGTEDPAVHELKGRALWTEVLRRAVRDLQRVPAEPREIVVQGVRLTLRPADVTEAMSRARRSGRPHNLARETFVLWLLERLTDQYARATRQDASDADTRAWIREDIRTARDARREINLCWMPTTPVGLLERLWARPALLERLAPELTAAERVLLERPAGSALTSADVPLIDELSELLGPSEDAQAQRARLEARRREELVSYAAQAIASQDLGDGMVTAEMLADRMADTGPSLTLAERARSDRTWTYGHVVVDEAQELGAMAWRALARRCPVRSFTVVGDLAQYSGPHAPSSWAEVLSALGTDAPEGTVGSAGTVPTASAAPSAPRSGGRRRGRGPRRGGSTPLREEVLTVCYRTPTTIMAAAESVATALDHPPVYPVSSVRDLENCLAATSLSGRDADDEAWARVLRETVLAESQALDDRVGAGGGRMAVIAPDPASVARLLGQDPVLEAAMQAPGGDVLRARLAVMSPVTSKGLEFDTVVLVEAAEVGRRSPGDLYVAMTRPTRRLHLVSRHALPQGLPAGPAFPSAR